MDESASSDATTCGEEIVFDRTIIKIAHFRVGAVVNYTVVSGLYAARQFPSFARHRHRHARPANVPIDQRDEHRCTLVGLLWNGTRLLLLLLLLLDEKSMHVIEHEWGNRLCVSIQSHSIDAFRPKESPPCVRNYCCDKLITGSEGLVCDWCQKMKKSNAEKGVWFHSRVAWTPPEQRREKHCLPTALYRRQPDIDEMQSERF